MAQIDPVDIVIRAKNDAKAAFDEAIRQVSLLQTTSQRSSSVIKANFRDIAGVVGSISPAAAQVTSQVNAITGALSGLGAVGVTIGGVTAAVVGLGVAIKGALDLS